MLKQTTSDSTCPYSRDSEKARGGTRKLMEFNPDHVKPNLHTDVLHGTIKAALQYFLAFLNYFIFMNHFLTTQVFAKTEQ